MHETGIWKIRNNDTAERCYGTSFLIFKLPFCGKSCLTDFAKKFTFSIQFVHATKFSFIFEQNAQSKNRIMWEK